MTETLILLLGAYWVLAGLRLLIDPDGIERILDQFESNDALTFLGGIIVLLAGVAALKYHNIWTGWPETLVTIVLWGMAIEGALMIVYPKALFKFSRKIMPKPRVTRVLGGGIMALGVALVLV